jgi:HEAT repeat protein
VGGASARPPHPPQMLRTLPLLAAAVVCALVLWASAPGSARRAARPVYDRPSEAALPELTAPEHAAALLEAAHASGGPSADEAHGQVAELLRLLDTDAPRRDRIVFRIAGIGGHEAWEGLVARLADPALRTSIEIALGRFAPPDVIGALKREMLAAPEAEARASIARILAATANPAHGKDIRALLERERDADVRHPAIGALGRFGDADSADALAELMRLGGRDAGTARFAFLEIEDEETLQGVAARWPELCHEARLGLLHAAAALDRPTKHVLAAAREALADGDERLRIAATGLLSRAGDEGVEPLLDHALRGSGDEAERTVRALLDLGTARAAEAGLRALERLPPSRQEHHRAGFLAVLGR